MVVESYDDFPGVQISIAGGVGEMVRANYCDRFFSFFLFFFLSFFIFKSSAFVLLRYKDSMHL